MNFDVRSSETQAKIDKIKADIRNKYHQDYFRNVRVSMR